jgi:hypothetical protein
VHLRRCPVCARDWADYQRVQRLARHLPVEPLPEALAHRLQAKLDQIKGAV